MVVRGTKEQDWMATYSSEDLGEFAEAIYKAANFDEAFQAFERLVFKLGFEGALYTFIPRIALDTGLPKSPVYHVSDTYSPDYLDHYAGARFDQNDPIVKAVAEGATSPLDWWIEVRKGYMKRNEKEVIVSARVDYDVVNGITIPTLSDGRGISGASFISSEADRLYEALRKETMAQLDLCTRIFHSTVMSNAQYIAPFIQPQLAQLTSNEKALLIGMSRGKQVAQIAGELGKTTTYMNRVMLRLREKFSGAEADAGTAFTRNQLMYYVGLLDLIDHL